jgi:hypothetical protein
LSEEEKSGTAEIIARKVKRSLACFRARLIEQRCWSLHGGSKQRVSTCLCFIAGGYNTLHCTQLLIEHLRGMKRAMKLQKYEDIQQSMKHLRHDIYKVRVKTSLLSLVLKLFQNAIDDYSVRSQERSAPPPVGRVSAATLSE